MGKRSLGRGMDDISDIFISETEEGESEKNFKGLSSVKIRDEDCSSCIHLILTNSRALCKVFTLENEKNGVPFKNTISLQLIATEPKLQILAINPKYPASSYLQIL